MKKQLFLIIVLCVALWSCTKQEDPTTIVTVKLNPSFISLNEGSNEPMKVKGFGLAKMNTTLS